MNDFWMFVLIFAAVAGVPLGYWLGFQHGVRFMGKFNQKYEQALRSARQQQPADEKSSTSVVDFGRASDERDLELARRIERDPPA